nr:flagellar hook-basal body complex protein FliE [Bacillus sp. Marseille-P3661]
MFNPVQNVNIVPKRANQKLTPAEAHNKFTHALNNAINDLNKTQIESDKTTEKFIKGEITDMHQVMIAAQKASVTRTAAIEVRNKVVEAYKEIMRMQI